MMNPSISNSHEEEHSYESIRIDACVVLTGGSEVRLDLEIRVVDSR